VLKKENDTMRILLANSKIEGNANAQTKIRKKVQFLPARNRFDILDLWNN